MYSTENIKLLLNIFVHTYSKVYDTCEYNFRRIDLIFQSHKILRITLLILNGKCNKNQSVKTEFLSLCVLALEKVRGYLYNVYTYVYIFHF